MGRGTGYTVSFLESVLYGLVSGLTEFVPVSSQGHQALMLRLFGLSDREPGRDVFVHIGILLALVYCCRTMFNYVLREQRLASNSRRRRNTERRSTYDLRLVKTAAFPLLIGLLGYFSLRSMEHNPAWLAVMFIINGILVIIPEYTRRGNKDGRFMSGWDGILLGLFGAASVFPGISRVAAMNLYTTLRGADRDHGQNWVLLLSVPVLIEYIVFDIINLFTLSIATVTFIHFLLYLLSAATAFCGAYLGIMLMRYLSVHKGYAGFAYYSWGAAMFCFVLYLIV